MEEEKNHRETPQPMHNSGLKQEPLFSARQDAAKRTQAKFPGDSHFVRSLSNIERVVTLARACGPDERGGDPRGRGAETTALRIPWRIGATRDEYQYAHGSALQLFLQLGGGDAILLRAVAACMLLV